MIYKVYLWNILKNDFIHYIMESIVSRWTDRYNQFSIHFRQMHTPFLQLSPLRRWAKHLIAQAEWLMLSHFDCHDKTLHVTLRCRSSSGSLESINSVSGSIFSSSICPSEKFKSWILFVYLIYVTYF